MKANKILIVEDQILIANDIKEILISENYVITAVSRCVDDAIIEIQKQLPDLILIDIQLIGIKNGIDLAQYLIDTNQIPFLFLTSVSDKLLLNEMQQTRPMGFISKPFKDIDLINMVSIALKNFNLRKVDFHCQTSADYSEVPFKIRKTILYIDENISKNITVDDLAAFIGLEKNYYIKVFKKYFNDTPYQYILKQKIAKSMLLLKETNHSLTDIAYQLGFPNYNSFWEKFKNLNSICPKSFRARYRQNNKNDNPNM